jgi:hypothetical protein
MLNVLTVVHHHSHIKWVDGQLLKRKNNEYFN